MTSSERTARAGGSRRSHVVVVLALALGALAAGATTVAGVSAAPPVDFALPLLAWVAAFALAEWSTTNLEMRGHVISYSVVEVVSSFALLLAAPVTFVAARTIGNTLTQLRRRSEPHRVLFNGAMFAAEAAVAAAVFHLLVDSGEGLLGPAGWAAGVVAVAAGQVVNAAAIAAVVRATGGGNQLRVLGQQITAMAPLTLLQVAVGVTAAQLTIRDGRAVFLGAGLALLLRWLLGRLGSAARRVATLRDFQGHTARLQAATTVEEAVGVATASIHDLTGASWAEVLGPGMDEPVESERGDLGGFAAASRRAAPLAAPTARPLTREEAAARRSDRGHVVPLLDDDGRPVGYVAAAHRAAETRVPEAAQLMATIARQVEAALRRADLARRLQAEVADRAHRALHDPRTGLPNRANLAHRIDGVGAGRRAGDGSLAVLVVRLTRLRAVAETLGHDRGEEVLAAAVERLRGMLRRGDELARLGSHTLGVVAPGLDHVQAQGLARRVVAVLEPIYELDGLRLDVGAHVGVAVGPQHGGDGEALLRAGERALEDAADHTSSVAVFTDDDGRALRRLAIAAELRVAADRGDVRAHFQPKLDVRTGRVKGVEALARWNHPELGQVSPGEFVPIAEQGGAIVPLTLGMLDQSLAWLARQEQLGRPLSVAVNISPRMLAEDDAVRRLGEVLDRHDVRRDRVVLEVTESMFVGLGRAEIALAQLRGLGVQLAIDDYGTGYSSLSYLHRLDVDELKIDRSFLLDLADDPARRVVLASTISLAHDLGMRVVAEGVEDLATLRTLDVMGCDVQQGFLAARPMPPDDLDGWLDSLDAGCWRPPRDALARPA